MHALLMLLFPIIGNLFASSVEQALSLTQSGAWKEAAAALDTARADDPTLFLTNNLHYLRGRLAEAENDWARAADEFAQIGAPNPLRPLAAGHGALAAIRLGRYERAVQLINELPPDFPVAMKMELARTAPPTLALLIYNGLTTRNARVQRAILLGETSVFWALLRENNADDAALESAQRLTPIAATPREWLDLAKAFVALRHFDEAVAQYQRLAADPTYSAEAQFQLGRIQFLKENYAAAVETYRSVAAKFPGTDWQKDADYQIATTYWRMRQYKDAEKAFLDYIGRYGGKGILESAVRDLADVYRSLGENAKALSLLDRTLTRRPTTATRQVLLFTKAKILYAEKRYSVALEIFRQLGRERILSSAGGTTLEEVRYFEALCLTHTGKAAAAKTALQKLAANPLTYYGQKAAVQLALTQAPPAQNTVCEPRADATLSAVTGRLIARGHPLRSEAAAPTDAVAELVFMRLWDEASVWLDRIRRPDPALAADLGYAAGRFHRSIAQADRLPDSNPDAMALQYPAGFRETICSAATSYSVDPLWLHAIIWQESKYDPNAHSNASARGLMQFIPETAEAAASAAGVPGLTLERLYEPETNIKLGAYYWSTLMEEFKYPELALAAYNGGPDNVRRWKDKSPGTEAEFFVSEIGFVETKRYVQAVFGARAAYGRLN